MMSKRRTAVMVGATGLVGKIVLELLVASDQYDQITVLTRRPTGLKSAKINEQIIDFENLSTISFQAQDAFCCLGTTRKQAGSKQKFYQVDYTYVYQFARLAHECGVQQFLMISSMGANEKSIFYYSQVKGKIEKTVQNIDFEYGTKIFRPSLLLGNRSQKRFGEQISKRIFTLFSALIPKKYQAIQAQKVANMMLRVALQVNPKSTIYQSDMMQ